MIRSAHFDSFAREHLPPHDEWPEFIFTIPEVRYPERINCGAELLDMTVARGFGNRPAIISDGTRLTYAELLAEANRIARVLHEDLGVVPGNRVLLRGYNNATMAACWLAVMKAGAVAVTTMPLLRAKELTDVITAARVNVAMCDIRLAQDLEEAVSGCPWLEKVIYTHDERPTGLRALASAHRATFDNIDTAADDVCMIAFTSGTTGKPKGTMHFHRDVLAVCDTFPPSSFAPVPGDVFTGTPPLAFTFGLGGILLFPLRAGASTVLIEKPSPEAVLAAIAEHRITVCFAAPTAYRAMTPLVSRYELSSLRACISAGESLPVATRSAWEAASGVRIIDGIGSTELLHIFISAAGEAIRPGATGMPVPGFAACVLDDLGRPLPAGNVGRLAVKGPTGCRYLSDPRQRDYVQGGWNITGDAYLMDEEGYFWYQARTDDMIVSAGYNIAGPEVEAALLEHPRVSECAVVGQPDADRGSIVKAYVVVRDGGGDAALARELQEFVKARIAPYKYPRALDFVTALPRTETGKVQRFKLRNSAARS
ncbi:MAG: AMP-binding protein [Candidatus Velthaea sp.]